jgi:hypothetical protein
MQKSSERIHGMLTGFLVAASVSEWAFAGTQCLVAASVSEWASERRIHSLTLAATGEAVVHVFSAVTSRL